MAAGLSAPGGMDRGLGHLSIFQELDIDSIFEKNRGKTTACRTGAGTESIHKSMIYIYIDICDI